MSDATSATIRLERSLDVHSVGPWWRREMAPLLADPARRVVVDASAVDRADDAGVALLFTLARLRPAAGAQVVVDGLSPRLAALVDRFDPKDFAPRALARPPGAVASVGIAAAAVAGDARSLVVFLGQAVAALSAAVVRPHSVRWREVWDVAREAGANAVPITLLIGFLMGVIIAFQTAVVAQQFGAVIFVVNGVGIAMLRELGPLMTAIVFAGRTGAAFAAEIGTQKVNEELDALVTFGLDPVRFLVLPRLLASLLVVPLLAALAMLIGLVGGALVMLKFDVSFLQYYSQLRGAVGLSDLLVGLAKAAVFGLVVAGIGCQRGLATGLGAASVGRSATRAVVTGIVLIVVIDGVFAVVTDRLGV
jgi:phospholipid/cholesterol/gamma-HCH transport system permease protein